MHDRALGYTTGAIADPGVTLRQRHIITVNCMDQAAICGLIQTCLLVAGGTISPNAQAFYYAPTTTSLNPAFLGSTVAFYLAHTVAIDVGGNGQASVPKHAPVHANLDPHREFIGNKKLTQHAREPGTADIYRDTAVLHMLRTGRLHGSIMTPIQVRRVNRRSRGYRAEYNTILRIMNNGTTRIVPPPLDRDAAVRHAHQLSGHFGIRRTMHLLLQTYWWTGIMKDVATEVNKCEVCNRTKAAFNSTQPTLHPQGCREYK